jgi:hypothetical protein
MCGRTVAIYCFIDDLLKTSEYQEDYRAEVTDAESLLCLETARLWNN